MYVPKPHPQTYVGSTTTTHKLMDGLKKKQVKLHKTKLVFVGK